VRDFQRVIGVEARRQVLEREGRLPDVLVFHSGTVRQDSQVVTAGGRVLTVVGTGEGYREAIDCAYGAAARISFDGLHKRSDIARRALDVRSRA